jgi:hypothetical protein
LHVVDTDVLLNENVAVGKHATLTGVDWEGLQNDVGALFAGSAIVKQTGRRTTSGCSSRRTRSRLQQTSGSTSSDCR